MQSEMSLRILYEDDTCIVPEKMQGVESEDAGEHSLPAYLRALLLKRGERAEIYPVHRLDKVTGGAILYAKSKEAAAYYSALVANRGIGKTYLALLCGSLPEQRGELRDYLYHDRRQNKVFAVKTARKGAKEAILRYTVEGYSMVGDSAVTQVLVELLTGRTHQIRAQFAHRGFPVYGDRRYGAKTSLGGGKIALWSHTLTFVPMGKQEAITVSSEPADAFPIDR